MRKETSRLIFFVALLGLFQLAFISITRYNDKIIQISTSSIAAAEASRQIIKSSRGQYNSVLKNDNTTTLWTGVIVYLITPGRIKELQRSLILLFKHFNARFQYPILLFHESKDSQWLNLETILAPLYHRFLLVSPTNGERLEIGELFRLVPVDLQLPQSFLAEKLASPNRTIVFSHVYPGYQLMISFWWKWIFEHPAVRPFTHMLRLDTDSYILGNIGYDLFERMHQKQYVYGYRVGEFDPAEVTVGLLDFVEKFTTENNISQSRFLPYSIPPPTDRYTSAPLYYNNFEIINLQAYLSHPVVRNFTGQVFATNGIFWQRWGDAPLRFFAIRMAFESSQIHHFQDFIYKHQSFHCYAGISTIAFLFECGIPFLGLESMKLTGL